MIGSQTLTRHVLFTCVLFIWFQLWLLAFVHQEPEELLKRGNRWVSWRKAYRPILQNLTHFYQPNVCVSAVILARNSLQKPKDFSFGILYRHLNRLQIQISIKGDLCGIPDTCTTSNPATLWNVVKVNGLYCWKGLCWSGSSQEPDRMLSNSNNTTCSWKCSFWKQVI